MKQAIDVILTAIIADLLAAFATAIVISIFSDSDYALLAIIWMTGNIFIPTLLAVILFRFIKSITNPSYTFKRFIKQSLILLIVFLIGLILWSALDVVFNDIEGNTFFAKMWQDFTTQFLGFVPATVSISFAIPSIDYLLSRKIKTSTDSNF